MSQNVCKTHPKKTLTHYPEMSEMACLKNHTILLQISVVVQPACYPSPLLLLLLFLLLQLLYLLLTIKVSQCKLLSRLLCHRLLPNFFEQSSEIRYITRPPFPPSSFMHFGVIVSNFVKSHIYNSKKDNNISCSSKNIRYLRICICLE